MFFKAPKFGLTPFPRPSSANWRVSFWSQNRVFVGLRHKSAPFRPNGRAKTRPARAAQPRCFPHSAFPCPLYFVPPHRHPGVQLWQKRTFSTAKNGAPKVDLKSYPVRLSALPFSLSQPPSAAAQFPALHQPPRVSVRFPRETARIAHGSLDQPTAHQNPRRQKKASRDALSPKARCAFDAPSTWLSLAKLRPRRARLRFTKQRRT